MDSELVVFGGTANAPLAQRIAQALKIELGQSELVRFSNETLFPRILQNVRERDVFLVQSLYPGTSDAIMEMLLTIDALRRASAARITAVIPYYAYGRSDKKDQPRVPISSRLLADLILAAGCDRALTLDLHAGQIQGFFTIPVDELTAGPILAEYVLSLHLANPVVVSTDLGFAKRARGFANGLGLNVALIEKSRKGNTGQTEVLGLIGNVRDMTAILVDDEVDSAGSMCHAAELLMQEGAREIVAVCTHALLAENATERIQASPISRFITTDSVFRGRNKQIPKLFEVSISGLMAEAIRRIHTGESIGALFKTSSKRL